MLTFQAKHRIFPTHGKIHDVMNWQLQHHQQGSEYKKEKKK